MTSRPVSTRSIQAIIGLASVLVVLALPATSRPAAAVDEDRNSGAAAEIGAAEIGAADNGIWSEPAPSQESAGVSDPIELHGWWNRYRHPQRPVVTCSTSTSGPIAPYDALVFSGSHSPSHLPVTYSFDHGDGTIDRRQTSHAYYKSPGWYTVTMSWEAPGGHSGTQWCGAVLVVGRPAVAPHVTCSISPVGAVEVGEPLVFSATHWPPNAAVDYVFDHGDGTLDPGAISNAYYTQPGTYEVKLQWSTASHRGSHRCGDVTVTCSSVAHAPGCDLSPTIYCNISPTGNVNVGQPLVFSATHWPTEAAVSYVFDHGDGTLGPGAISNAYYTQPGTYEVKLQWSHAWNSGVVSCGLVTVTAPYGCLDHLGHPTICIDPPPPAAPSCSISKTSVAVGEYLVFQVIYPPGYIAGSGWAFAFDHGDGTIDSRATSNAYYEAAGTYNVQLQWANSVTSGTQACGTVVVS